MLSSTLSGFQPSFPQGSLSPKERELIEISLLGLSVTGSLILQMWLWVSVFVPQEEASLMMAEQGTDL